MANDIKGVPIFKAGTFIPGNTGVPAKFTTDDLWEMARNFSELNRRAPIKLGHSTNQVLAEQEDGDPALGRVTNLRVDGDRLLADLIDIPDVLYTAIKAGLWSEISAELDFIETRGWTLRAIAILGANLPAVSNLGELQAYLSANPSVGKPGSDAVMCFAMANPTTIGGSAMADLEKDKVAFDNERVAFAEEQRVFFFTSAFDSAKLTLEKQVIVGKMTPAIRDKIVKRWETVKPTFRKGDELGIPADMLGEIMQLSATMPSGEQATGSQGGDLSSGNLSSGNEDELPDAILARKAQILMAQHTGLDYGTASRQVLMIDPQLKKQYFAQTTAEVRELVTGRV